MIDKEVFFKNTMGSVQRSTSHFEIDSGTN